MPDIAALLGSFGDVLVALVLLAIVGGVLFATRAGVLPKSSFPVALGAAAAIIGIRIFTRQMDAAYRRQIEEVRARLTAREDDIRRLEDVNEDARREVTAARAALHEQLAALQAATIRLHEDDERVRGELSTASLDEIDRLYMEARARVDRRLTPADSLTGVGR